MKSKKQTASYLRTVAKLFRGFPQDWRASIKQQVASDGL